MSNITITAEEYKELGYRSVCALHLIEAFAEIEFENIIHSHAEPLRGKEYIKYLNVITAYNILKKSIPEAKPKVTTKTPEQAFEELMGNNQIKFAQIVQDAQNLIASMDKQAKLLNK